MNTRPRVLAVDDIALNLELLRHLLESRYEVILAPDGASALRLAGLSPLPDLILLDVMMPDINGYTVCARLKSDARTADIPVIFLTANTQRESEARGFHEGAVDYISKPIHAETLLARVATHIQLKQASALLKDQNKLLEHLVARRTAEVEAMQDATILAMASLAETRDNETGNHIRRTQHYMASLARQLQDHPRFCAELSNENITLLFKSAALHDIGKVGIPDRILLKPGKLDTDEFETMKLHTVYGRDTLLAVEHHLGTSSAFLRYAREIAYAHHEKFDGSGYPEGLAGDAIPIAARLMAVADVYDALISKRVYKAAMDHDTAIGIIHQGRGTHFDGDIVDALLTIQNDFARIAQKFHDENTHHATDTMPASTVVMKPPEKPAMPAMPAVHVQQATLRGFSSRAQQSIRRAFVSEAPRLLAVVKSGLDTADSKTVALAAHSLKGSAGYFGATDLQEQCQQIEQAANGNNLAWIAQQIPALQQTIDTALERINSGGA
ncbi:MAG: response regulator [Rhodoferax sp.]|nr:response regulator [Rhodoferax sp.]